MKRKYLFWGQHLLLQIQTKRRHNRRNRFASNQGLSLIELIVASLITSVVILVAWSGLMSVLNMSQIAEARTARQVELNQALDFMTNEIRMSRSINQTATLTANGTTVTVADVVASSGLNLGALGSYGTIALYLERPTQSNIPALCPVGGPNAGAVPPAPADYDRIVYDIRPNPSGWLGPRIVTRYGRVPSADGTINPCKTPVSSDPMVDALSTTMNTPPTCSGVLSGADGFKNCVNGKQVDLFFQSDITSVEAKQIRSSVASRLVDFPATPATSELTLTGIRPLSTNNLNFTWAWSNGGSATNYVLHKTWQGYPYTPYTGTSLSFDYHLNYASPGESVCFKVTAQTGATTVDSNQVCFTK